MTRQPEQQQVLLGKGESCVGHLCLPAEPYYASIFPSILGISTLASSFPCQRQIM